MEEESGYSGISYVMLIIGIIGVLGFFMVAAGAAGGDVMNNTVEFIDAALLPQLDALVRAAIMRNDLMPRDEWVTVLPQAILQADGDLRITALALPADLAQQIKTLIGSRLGECGVLTHDLMQHYTALAEGVQP